MEMADLVVPGGYECRIKFYSIEGISEPSSYFDEIRADDGSGVVSCVPTRSWKTTGSRWRGLHGVNAPRFEQMAQSVSAPTAEFHGYR
jgi:hypothetical protein